MGKNKKILIKIFGNFFLYVSIGPPGYFGGPGGKVKIFFRAPNFSGLLLGPKHNTKSQEEVDLTKLKYFCQAREAPDQAKEPHVKQRGPISGHGAPFWA